MAPLTRDELRRLVTDLAAIERPSASEGERHAADVIAGELTRAGAEVRIEEERVHGTYWWPIGLLTGAAAMAGLTGRRGLGTAAGLAAAAAVADDITCRRQWFRRRLLPARTTANVVAEIGPADAPRTALVCAHYDAPHTGLVFHPEIPRLPMRRSRWLREHAHTTVPTMWGAIGGPLMVAIGALAARGGLRRAGVTLSLGYAAAMTNIGMSGVVPGANDNLSAVAALVSLARSLAAEPVPGLRVILLAPGSEESFQEGMQAFGRRHFPSLDRDSTYAINLDTVGSPHLVALEGEGMAWMNDYSKPLLRLVHECAEELGVFVWKGLRTRQSSDGLIPLNAGYQTLTMASCDELKAPTNYHWPTDTPDNVDYGTVEDAARLCRAVLERLAA